MHAPTRNLSTTIQVVTETGDRRERRAKVRWPRLEGDRPRLASVADTDGALPARPSPSPQSRKPNRKVGMSPQKKPSVRYLATNNREVCFVLHKHMHLSVEEFRQPLESDLRDLRLSEESRLS